jgi:hypothetical protein
MPFDDGKKGQWEDHPCTECGIRAGKNYITSDGTGRTVKHYFAGSVRDGCHLALVEEVKRLRDQVDYLTDLVETPNTPVPQGYDIKSVNPTFGQVQINGKWRELRVKQLGGAMGSTFFVVAEEAS